MKLYKKSSAQLGLVGGDHVVVAHVVRVLGVGDEPLLVYLGLVGWDGCSWALRA